MIFLFISILLNMFGMLVGSWSYLFPDHAFAYFTGTAASVAFLVGFLLLEHALARMEFTFVIISWAAGLSLSLSAAAVLFWGEGFSIAKAGFGGLVLAGLVLLLINHIREEREGA